MTTQIREGYVSPVGATWHNLPHPTEWYDSNPPFNRYRIPGQRNFSVHTGIDLQLANNADLGRPVYAIMDGTVIFASRGRGTWGNLIVIQHNAFLCSRYAHLERMHVSVGQKVAKGLPIGTIGKTGLEYVRSGEHLHFDMSYSGILTFNPQHWPGDNIELCAEHYLHATNYLLSSNAESIVVAYPRLRVRREPSFSAPIVGFLKHNSLVTVVEYHGDWARISSEDTWVFGAYLFGSRQTDNPSVDGPTKG